MSARDDGDKGLAAAPEEIETFLRGAWTHHKSRRPGD